MKKHIGVTALVLGGLMLGPVPIAAQWPKIPDPTVPRDAKGNTVQLLNNFKVSKQQPTAGSQVTLDTEVVLTCVPRSTGNG